MKKSVKRGVIGTSIIALCIVGFIGGVHVLRNGLPSEWKGLDYEEEVKVEQKEDTYTSKSDTKVEKKEPSMRIGSNVYVKKTMYFPVTEEYAEEFYQYLHANNKDGISMMLLEGKLFIPDLGEKYAIKDKGWLNTELKSMKTGQIIFVSNSLLEEYFSE